MDEPVDEVGVVVTTVVGAAVVAAIVVVVGCWKVTGIDASVTPWAWTVTWVVPNGTAKLCVAVSPAGTVTGAGDAALVPLNVIEKGVEPSAANA
ncbi:MAG: hypothetical protein ACHQDC_00950, partial [Acidimicrobiales bacterium]